jgi:DNA-binding NtrC family response regulator
MAKVLLTGVEESVADCIRHALNVEKHQIEERPSNAPGDDFLAADVVFAGGGAIQYLPLLQRVRKMRPALPFIVVTITADTTEWLTALEAGATDYCAAPLVASQINWLMETALRYEAR